MSKSIRSVLEGITPCVCSFIDGWGYDKTKPCHCGSGKVIDQALKDIAQIIDEAKPDFLEITQYDSDKIKQCAVEEYKSNLREALL